MRTWTLYTRAWNDPPAHYRAHPKPLQSGDSLQHTCRNMRKRKKPKQAPQRHNTIRPKTKSRYHFPAVPRVSMLSTHRQDGGEGWTSCSFPSLMLRWLSWAFSKHASLMRIGSLWWKYSKTMGKHILPSWSEPSEVLRTVLILRVLLCILHLAQLLCW